MNKKYNLKSSRTFVGLIATCLLTSSTAISQNQNALSFDGVDDEVVTANASSLISGSTSISLSCWVYPQHTPAGYPDFDGFCGLRNEVDADFYFLMLNAGLECRFRNSGGTTFTITSAMPALNVWQHYAMTYDGSMLRVFKNGFQTDSLVASGVITSTISNFYMGSVYYSSQDFFLQGMLDEVSLWNKKLTSAEVNCLFHNASNPTDVNLKLYYPLNQGIAGGTNTGLTTATDVSLHTNGSINNLALSGASSNWVGGVLNFTSVSALFCPGGTYSFYGQALTIAGVYNGYAPISGGCDSVLQLTLSAADTAVSIVGGALHANQNGATYQWINCTTGGAVSGATNQNFIPSVNGNYKCSFTIGSMTCTTSCSNYNFVGITESENMNGFKIYPSPAEDVVFIQFDQSIPNYLISVYDLIGKKVYEKKYFNSQSEKINISELKSGFYFIELNSETKKATLSFVKK